MAYPNWSHNGNDSNGHVACLITWVLQKSWIPTAFSPFKALLVPEKETTSPLANASINWGPSHECMCMKRKGNIQTCAFTDHKLLPSLLPLPSDWAFTTLLGFCILKATEMEASESAGRMTRLSAFPSACASQKAVSVHLGEAGILGMHSPLAHSLRALTTPVVMLPMTKQLVEKCTGHRGDFPFLLLLSHSTSEITHCQDQHSHFLC